MVTVLEPIAMYSVSYISNIRHGFSEFSVRSVSLADLDGVTELIQNLSQNRKVRKDLTTLISEEDTSLGAYVLECEASIVGVALIS